MQFNKVILVGRITHDPEMKIGNGKPLIDFQLAVNRYGKKDESDFFKIVCFGKTAEFLSQYVKKGQLLLVEGSLRDNRWTDEYGKERRKTEIMAQRIQLLEKKKEEEQLPPPEVAYDTGSEKSDEEIKELETSENADEAPF